MAKKRKKAVSLLTKNKRLKEALEFVLDEHRDQLREQYRGWDHAKSRRPAAEVYIEYTEKEVERILNGSTKSKGN